MKLCHLIYIVWCLLRRGQGVSQEDNLRESDNTLIEGLAIENPELENDDSKGHSYIEKLSDFEDTINEEYSKDHEVDGVLRAMSNNEFEGQDERVADPIEFTRFTWKDAPRLAEGHGHQYCGPYTYHYTKSQDCKAVGLHYHGHDSTTHITVKECEEHCEARYRCNAFNWSHKPQLGCVLRECGFSNVDYPPRPFPMPIGYNPDFVSYSKFEPLDIPQCQPHDQDVSYDTPNEYCGPYNKIWHPDSEVCKKIGEPYTRVKPLQCETHCGTKLGCTGFVYNPKANKCILISCTGRAVPIPTFVPPPTRFGDYAGYTKSYSKDKLPDRDCILDDRPWRRPAGR